MLRLVTLTFVSSSHLSFVTSIPSDTKVAILRFRCGATVLPFVDTIFLVQIDIELCSRDQALVLAILPHPKLTLSHPSDQGFGCVLPACQRQTIDSLLSIMCSLFSPEQPNAATATRISSWGLHNPASAGSSNLRQVSATG